MDQYSIYKKKYLKYKTKYQRLSKIMGGSAEEEVEYLLYENSKLSNAWTDIKSLMEKNYDELSQETTIADKEATKKYIVDIIEKAPQCITTGKCDTLWNQFNGSIIESNAKGHIYVTLDPNYVQIMFLTLNGYTRIILYPKTLIMDNIDKVYFKLTKKLINNLKSTDDLKKLSEQQIDLTESQLYQDYNTLKAYQNVDDKYSMKNVLEYMHAEYSTQARPFIAILGKARFWMSKESTIATARSYDKNADVKTLLHRDQTNFAVIKAYTDTFELFSNLLFRNCNLGFMTGGYSGIKSNAYGITRSGYELSKHFEKPIVGIMCNAGLSDSHQNTDAMGLYGMHWGDDTEALSLMADAGIFIAPFGAWTYVELSMLALRKKPAVIYYDAELLEKKDTAKLGYGTSDKPCFDKLDNSKNDNYEKYKIDPVAFFGEWIHHHEQLSADPIPIVKTYSAAAKYILDNLGSACEFTTKARILNLVLNEKDLEYGKTISNKLNRQLKAKLDIFTGRYDVNPYTKANLEKENIVSDFCNH